MTTLGGGIGTRCLAYRRLGNVLDIKNKEADFMQYMINHKAHGNPILFRAKVKGPPICPVKAAC